MSLFVLCFSEAGPQKDQYDIAALNEKHIVERIQQVVATIRQRHERVIGASNARSGQLLVLTYITIRLFSF